jgi:hypothetical protein
MDPVEAAVRRAGSVRLPLRACRSSRKWQNYYFYSCRLPFPNLMHPLILLLVYFINYSGPTYHLAREERYE